MPCLGKETRRGIQIHPDSAMRGVTVRMALIFASYSLATLATQVDAPVDRKVFINLLILTKAGVARLVHDFCS